MENARVLVVSDVHGNTVGLRWLLRHETADAMFFLGDGLRDLDNALQHEKPRWPIYRVRGNCDPGCPDPAEGLAPIAGVLFFYTHGHLYYAKPDGGRVGEEAAARGADVALFGHTHHARHRCEMHDGRLVELFNPGALLNDSYGVITVRNGRAADFAWATVPV